jgi:hypothetical protein
MVQADGMGRPGTYALLEYRRTVSMTESNRILVHRVGDPAPWSARESSSYMNEPTPT